MREGTLFRELAVRFAINRHPTDASEEAGILSVHTVQTLTEPPTSHSATYSVNNRRSPVSGLEVIETYKDSRTYMIFTSACARIESNAIPLSAIKYDDICCRLLDVFLLLGL